MQADRTRILSSKRSSKLPGWLDSLLNDAQARCKGKMRTDCWLIGSHDTHNSTADKAAQTTGSHLSLGNHNSKQKDHWHCQGCWWESHQFRRYLFIRIITIHPEGSSMDWIERKQYVNVYTQFVCADRLTGLIERAAAKAAFWKKLSLLTLFPSVFCEILCIVQPNREAKFRGHCAEGRWTQWHPTN